MNRRSWLGSLVALFLGRPGLDSVLDVPLVRADVPAESSDAWLGRFVHTAEHLRSLPDRLTPVPVHDRWEGRPVGRVLTYSFDGRWLRARVRLDVPSAAAVRSGVRRVRPAAFPADKTPVDGGPAVATVRDFHSLFLTHPESAFWGDLPG